MAMNNDDQSLDELQALLENNPPADASNQPAPPMDADRLYSAQKSDNQQKFYANLLRSFQGMLQNAAPNSGFKADLGLADNLAASANAEAGVKTQLGLEAAGRKEARENEKFKMDKDKHALEMDDFQMKLEKSKLDFQDMQANRDPASPQSKIAQDRVLEVQRKMKQPVNEAQIRGMSGADLYKYFDYLKEDLTRHYQNENARLDREAQSTRQDKEISSREKMDREKMANDLEKTKLQETKEDKKADRAETKQIGKENRKLRTELDKAEQSVATQIKEIEDTIKQFDNYSKKSMTGTGPIATAGGLTKYVSQGTEALDSKFKKMGFTELVKQFQGMSKAIDSDGERRAFEATQPSVTLDDKTNRQILSDKLQAAQSLLAKTQAAKAKFDREGRFTEDDPKPEGQETQQAPYGDTVQRNGKNYKWNAGVGKYQLVE